MADKINPTQFKMSLFSLIVNAMKDPKTFVRTVFYGFPALYAGYAIYMAEMDVKNAWFWAASPVLVTFACMTFGGAISDYLAGFNINALLKRWVVEEQAAVEAESVQYQGVSFAVIDGIEEAVIDPLLFNGKIIVGSVPTGLLHIFIKKEQGYVEEQQARFEKATGIVWSNVPDPFADDKPQPMKGTVLDNILASPHPLKALLALRPSVDLKLDIIWAQARVDEFKALKPEEQQDFITNMLDPVVENTINHLAAGVEADKAKVLFDKYYKVGP